jgi:hypothetical protein
LSTVSVAIAITAVLAGITGSWSPCGFSMISTLGPGGHSGGLRTALSACATFSIGALIGGVVTFGGLAALGALIAPAGPGIHGALAAAIAVAAAAGEARGARVVPQIRRQVPEHWRRVMPLPVAGGLYGILLGLGFTTFVLTLAVWALAGIAVASGEPALGVLIGICFGAGRALPIIALAPISETNRGIDLVASMAERPVLLRGLRLADGAALLLCALAFGADGAFAATVMASPGTDPSVAGADVAWQQPSAAGLLARGPHRILLPGQDATLGGSWVAWRNQDRVTVARRATLAPIESLSIPGARKLAISDRWLVYRRQRGDREEMIARAVQGSPRTRLIGAVRFPAQLGRPAIDGNLVVFHTASGGESVLVGVNLRTGRRTTLRRSTRAQYLNPAVAGSRLLYVFVGGCTQQLRLGSLNARRPERVLLRIGCSSTPDQLWTTALSAGAAYLTRLSPTSDGSTRATLLRIPS